MTIVRQKTHSQNFVILHKLVLQDPELSLKAKGLWAYLMSLPDDWHINCREVSKHTSDGRDSVLKGLKELEKHGYAEKVQQKQENGKFGYGSWVVFESKKEITDDRKPCPENPYPEIAYTETAPILSTKDSKERKKTPTPLKGEAAGAAGVVQDFSHKKEKKLPSEKTAIRDHVMLTPDELEFLKVLHGESKLGMMLDTLDSWKGSTGKKYKSDYHTLKPGGWVHKRYEDEKPTQEQKKGREYESSNFIHYDANIAELRKNQGEESYITYLKKVSDNKYYNDYMQSKENK